MFSGEGMAGGTYKEMRGDPPLNASEIQAMHVELQQFRWQQNHIQSLHFVSSLHLFEKMEGKSAECRFSSYFTSFEDPVFSAPGMEQ